MPAIQTAYTARIAPAFEGLVANSEDHIIVSKQLESAAGVGFGKAVFQGTADDGVIAAPGTKFLGITEASHFASSASGVDLYARYETVPVLIKGPIWVQASEAVAAGDPVYVNLTTGVWSKTASGNTLLANARWDTSTSGAGLAVIAIR
jgi:hypothetical protein